MKSNFKIFNKILIDENKTILNALNMLNSIKLDDSLSRLILFVTSKEKVVGSVTDGDVRRMLQKDLDINKMKAKDIMTKKPKSVAKDAMAIDALQIMKKHNITQLAVANAGKLLGFVHLHDLLEEGII